MFLLTKLIDYKIAVNISYFLLPKNNRIILCKNISNSTGFSPFDMLEVLGQMNVPSSIFYLDATQGVGNTMKNQP